MKITFAKVERMIARSKKNFLKSSFSKDEIKSIVKNIDVIIYFNNGLKVAVGRANSLTMKQIKEFPIDIKSLEKIKKYDIDNELHYLIIELNEKLLKRRGKKFLFDTVSHELAHCVDFILRGNLSSRKRRWHDKVWKTIHLDMGGDGKATF